MRTKAEVFIIESLDPDDEGNGRFEGSIISKMLRLHGKNPKYRYVRTKKDFKKAVTQFGRSQYRYLHISAHADEDGMCTTNLDEIDYNELSQILTPVLSGRRLFLSACSMVHEDMAKEIIPSCKCYSVIGPTENIYFSDAAIVWSSIYHLMFSKDSDRMTRKFLKESLMKVCKLFEVNIAYFSISKKLKRGYTKDLLQ
ncbi:MAG: hypothetical protein K9N10_18780 [Deltaproteobacteria bacterium]|nr:hypothetical protein [Deltaproteobacteria bacterium]